MSETDARFQVTVMTNMIVCSGSTDSSYTRDAYWPNLADANDLDSPLWPQCLQPRSHSRFWYLLRNQNHKSVLPYFPLTKLADAVSNTREMLSRGRVL